MHLFLLVALASSSLVLAVDDSPRFGIQPRDTTTIYGETVTLYCSVSGLQSSQFVWVKDGTVITRGLTVVTVDADRYSLGIVEEGNYHLLITDSRAEDSGAFRCVATTGGTGLISTLATLQVFAAPAAEYPVCTGVGSNEVAVGERVTLSCDVEGGNPKAELFLNKGDVSVQAAETATGIAYTWTVGLEDDAAEFICIGTQRFWAEPRTCRLGPFTVVRGPPTVSLVPAETTVQTGQSVSFLCSAASAPRADFKWYVAGQEVTEDGVMSVQVIGESSILLIHDVGDVDESRQIMCIVDASTGTVAAEAAMHVQPVYAVVTNAPIERPQATKKTPVESPDSEGPTAPIDEAPSAGTGESEDTDTEDTNTEEAVLESTLSIALIAGCSAAACIVVLAVIVSVVLVRNKRSSSGDFTAKSTEQLAEGAVDDTDNYYFRSRGVGIVRSWLFPVHKDTQKGMAASVASTPPPRS